MQRFTTAEQIFESNIRIFNYLASPKNDTNMKILKIAALAAACIAIIACCPCRKGKSTAKNSLPLTQTRWQLVRVNALNITPDDNFEIVFHDDMSVNGIGACNRFFGKYTASNGKIKIGPLGSTRMMCPNMADENAFLAMLDKIDTYTIDGNTLMLLKNGELLGVLEGSVPEPRKEE